MAWTTVVKDTSFDVGSSGTTSCMRRTAVGITGKIYNIGNDDDKVYLYESIDNGDTWSKEIVFDGEGVAQFVGSLAIGYSDVVHVVWHRTIAQTAADRVYYRRRTSGVWSDVETISSGSGSSMASMIISTADILHIAYLKILSNRYTVYYTNNGAGSWLVTPERVSTLSQSYYRPCIAMGTTVVDWGDSRNAVHVYSDRHNAFNDPYSIVHRERDLDGVWSAETVVDTAVGSYPNIWNTVQSAVISSDYTQDVVFITGNDKVYYIQKPLGEAWAAKELVRDLPGIPTLPFASLTVDSVGTRRIVVGHNPTVTRYLYYSYKLVDGVSWVHETLHTSSATKQMPNTIWQVHPNYQPTAGDCFVVFNGGQYQFWKHPDWVPVVPVSSGQDYAYFM